MVLLLAAVLITAFVLPSALNLPQSNPSTVLEYAPVPPEDEDPPPPAEGNTSALGLGSSNSLGEGVPSPPPPPPPGEGDETTIRDKDCVGDRQTEDPASPPCVPYFEGDNFGATYQGVSAKEIRVLIYFDRGNYIATGQGAGEVAPDPGYIDAGEPSKPPCPQDGQKHSPQECDHILVRVTKAFQRYFNAAFQLYDRKVHFFVYFTEANTAALRKQDAADNWATLKPFAVIDAATFDGFNQEYQSAMAARGVLTFTQQTALPNAFYRQNAPLSWGFWPDVEHWADLYSSYVCQKLVPNPVEYYGRPQGQGAPNGEPRRFALWRTSDKGQPGLQLFAQQVKDKIEKCNANVVDEKTFSKSGFQVDATDSGQEARDAALSFQSNEVTTILYLGGVEGNLSKSLSAIRYYPEIVVAGDLANDSNANGGRQDPESWANAWAVTYHVRLPALEETYGYRAYREGYPDGPAERDGRYARDMYTDFFLLFTSIQVAGPRLNPATVDEGFHAIPRRESTDPFIGAFFFDRNDYSSIKDSAEQWWDASGRAPGSTTPGCWRMVREGRRFLAGTWEGGNDVFKEPSDPCTGYGGSSQIRFA